MERHCVPFEHSVLLVHGAPISVPPHVPLQTPHRCRRPRLPDIPSPRARVDTPFPGATARREDSRPSRAAGLRRVALRSEAPAWATHADDADVGALRAGAGAHVLDVARAALWNADLPLRLERIGTERARTAADVLDVARAALRAADGSRRHPPIRRALRIGSRAEGLPVAGLLRHATHAGGRELVGGTFTARAGAELGDVTLPGGEAARLRRRHQLVGTVVTRAVAHVGDVAVAALRTARRALRFRRIGQAVGGLPAADGVQLAGIRRRAADATRGVELVIGAILALAGAGLLRVALAGGRAAHGAARQEPVRRTGGTRPVAAAVAAGRTRCASAAVRGGGRRRAAPWPPTAASVGATAA